MHFGIYSFDRVINSPGIIQMSNRSGSLKSYWVGRSIWNFQDFTYCNGCVEI